MTLDGFRATLLNVGEKPLSAYERDPAFRSAVEALLVLLDSVVFIKSKRGRPEYKFPFAMIEMSEREGQVANVAAAFSGDVSFLTGKLDDLLVKLESVEQESPYEKLENENARLHLVCEALTAFLQAPGILGVSKAQSDALDVVTKLLKEAGYGSERIPKRAGTADQPV